MAGMPRDVMVRVLERCDGDALLAASAACSGWAAMAESVAERRCRARGWVLPRRPRRRARGAVGPPWPLGTGTSTSTSSSSSSSSSWPWLAFWRARQCRLCRGVREGEFPVRRRYMGPLVFLVCRACARDPVLARDALFVDVESVLGNRDLVVDRPASAASAASAGRPRQRQRQRQSQSQRQSLGAGGGGA